MLRSDYGTENPSVATAQIAFRMNDQDTLAAEKSFVYGLSPANMIDFVVVTVVTGSIYVIMRDCARDLVIYID